MKIKLYTLSHSKKYLKNIDKADTIFTADEHAEAIEREFGNNIYKTKSNLLRNYLSNEFIKVTALKLLIDEIIDNNYKNIISFGSGPSVLEYILKFAVPEDVTIVSTDFNKFLVDKVTEYFPEIRMEVFDLFSDNFEIFQNKLNIDFDIAVFFGSMYVMENYQIVKLLSSLKRNGLKEIIDYHGGFINNLDIFVYTFTPVYRFIKGSRDTYRGKFHGYGRNKSELRKLYKKSGLTIKNELKIDGYKYVAILN